MSSEPGKQPSGIIGEIADNLGALFRHLLPGALVFGAGRISHPSWFVHFDAYSWSFLAVVGVVAVAVGNAWFSVNRYVVHQLVDYICWLRGSEGPAKGSGKGYTDDLAVYVKASLSNEDVSERARQHISFRAASVLLIYTLSELLLAMIWSEPGAITYGCKSRILLFIGFLILAGAGWWQNLITRRIDAEVLRNNRA